MQQRCRAAAGPRHPHQDGLYGGPLPHPREPDAQAVQRDEAQLHQPKLARQVVEVVARGALVRAHEAQDGQLAGIQGHGAMVGGMRRLPHKVGEGR